MTIGIACPECRYLIGVPDSNIDVVTPVTDEAGVGVLSAAVVCPECNMIFVGRVEVIVPVLVEGGKRAVNVKA
jgi:DNA-directed RNA polymerase subunit RPC12/RpoP